MRRFSLPSDLTMEELPKPPQAEIKPAAFVLIPCGFPGSLSLDQWLYQRWLYLQAWEQAQAVVRPSLPERDLLAVWN